MNKYCNHEKIYGRKIEYYLFTWSIPNVNSIDVLNFKTGNYTLLKGYTYFATLYAAKDKIQFSIGSPIANLKCCVTIFIGSETLLFSNTLNAHTRKENISPFNCYFDLVNLTVRDECFQKLKQYSNETLYLICRIKYPANNYSTRSVKTANFSTNSLYNLKTLADGLKNSPESILKENVKLRVGEEYETVSKALLCARSPVFAKMFENRMIELKENTVTITDIEMPVLKFLISFLYTGKLSNCDLDLETNCDLDFLCKLYYVSDKYDIADLRQICVDLMLPNVTMENVIQVLKLAFAHNELRLKSTALAVIASNFDAWVTTNDWKNMVNDEPKIAVEVLNFFDF